MKILFFTDAHVEPHSEDDYTRFDLLGEMIVREQPDVIVQGGDFGSFPSLSEWDKDKRKTMELKRYKADIDSVNEAIRHIFYPMHVYNTICRSNKKKQYTPNLVWIDGNHEDWVRRYIDRNPVMEGIINLDEVVRIPRNMLRLVDFVRYNNDEDSGIRMVGGVAFTHAPRNRGGIINSKYISSRALAESFDCSVVFGHTHRFTVDSIARVSRTGNQEVRFAVSGGCFFEKVPGYALNNTNDYAPGVLMLEVHEGQIKRTDFVTLQEMREIYG